MATSQAGFFPVETYRDSSVSNGGTTVQTVVRTITENRTVTDTKDLVETILADVGGEVSFTIQCTNKTPVPIPIQQPKNPNTT